MRQDEGWPARDSGSRTVALGSAGCTQRARAVRTRHGSSLRWFESLSAVEKSKGHQQPKLSACTWEAQERSVSSEARLRAVTHGEHAATEDRAVLLRSAVLPGFARSPRPQRLWASSLLGFRHTARRRLRRAGLWRSREPGSLEPGATEQRALRTPVPAPPSGTRARWSGVAMGSAPERRWRGCRPFCTGTNY